VTDREENAVQDVFDAWNDFVFDLCFPALGRVEKERREIEEAKARPN
jgi:hypothetical protein